MRGYDRDEVDAFMEKAAEDFESLLAEVDRLNKEVLQLKTQLHDYQEIERTLKHALKSAEASVQQTVENARRQAEITLREADVQADKTLHDAKTKLAELKNELLLVRAQKDSFARRLRHLLESQLELIGVLEMDDLGFGEPEAAPAKAHAQTERAAAPPMSSAPRPAPAKSLANDDAARNETFRPTATREQPPRRPAMRAAGQEFYPVAEADSAATAGKKDPRLSDHLIT
jgi:cell division initiation protein